EAEPFASLAPLASDLVASLRIEGAEKIVEARVALVRPLELHAVTLEEARLGEKRCLLGGREEHVGARDIVQLDEPSKGFAEGGDEAAAERGGRDEQPW